jgi:predicted nucleic acid-binding protein
MICFDTNVLVYTTATTPEDKVKRARELVARALRTGSSILLLQTLAEFSSVAIRKAQIPVDDVKILVEAWRAVLPVQAAEYDDLLAALDAVKVHQLSFWDAMLWASAERAGVRHILTEDFHDGFVLRGVTFVNPFNRINNRLVDEILPPQQAGDS